ncbi:MAG TPA: bifunctional UDP-N-acetylglucosamine diphosphorylase/glucosamine-1-phosphate N-acetyltransferase GlmU [Povalibacter sp.]|uniref:bifunctional UDP-N-acetylglucosamine diphosphorylase/glucosamine-1-phosphate N-acetyltransferase GlmU n=1 Tax=Povalibacter sp. TaxID=1962978 RepID=UPI002CB70EAD|nr:bifunctional UDP-N-acetylglucosamine diphosphorylase/glucosamine-1-phosphate N-acetyltransferase GlmU [Povalibacter sp.]HMN47178.1 bifunctional UDP-N-acetylglucosamine diphosphorylase/glucosamine-1-phosphate N-acetyltransferase GlmU [Povalibacter sp.]
MSSPLSVVILAAGQGKRMKSDLPKVLQPLAGHALLSHVLDTAKSLGADAIHVVYGHGGDLVRERLSKEPVNWVLQAEQLGTGHAVAQAMPHIPDDHRVLILYGDVPLIRKTSLEQLLERCDQKSLGLLTVMLSDPTGYGRVVRDGAGNVVRIVEQKDANTKERAINEGNTGLMAMPAASLRKWLAALKNDNAQGEYYLTDVIVMAVRDGMKIGAVVAGTETEVLGVNDKVQLAQLEAALRAERATQLMLQGVTLADPARIDIRGNVTVGRDVFIDVNAVLVGNVHLGDRVRIGPNNYLKDCRIDADTEIHPNCVIDRANIGPRNSIGPFARLRPDAVLHEDVHIGNFVEVKKSELGAGSKANHLTYLGDATVGRKVNVGAGTVTVNYDGVNKHRTEIGDGAFIGSGSMLVAPVKIGANANTGAGSTITRDAPDSKLTLARARQVTIEGWKRPEKKT